MAPQVNGAGIPTVSAWRGYRSRHADCISFGEGGISPGIPTVSAWAEGSAEASQCLQGWSVSLRVQEGQREGLMPAAPTAPLVGNALKGTSA